MFIWRSLIINFLLIITEFAKWYRIFYVCSALYTSIVLQELSDILYKYIHRVSHKYVLKFRERLLG